IYLNSSVKNQVIRDSKSVFNETIKPSKYTKIPVMKLPKIVWNNQNYNVKNRFISVPFLINGNSTRVLIKAIITDDILYNIGLGIKGTLRISKKSNKWIAQISTTLELNELPMKGKTMGVDLGILIPGVVKTECGKVKFFGNGRQNKFYRRYYKSKRTKLGKMKKLNAIINMDDKEQRYMKDQDHKISRAIVNFAKEHDISIIKLEKLEGIRSTTRASRKNKKNLHNWSFYRLSMYIEYKAILEGIRVEYVDPKYTSQTCPKCGERHKAEGRKYKCKDCGLEMHRDLVGATNIIKAPVICGKSKSA
ncbi:MAG: RNA-guided endonuclease TnpB family protein, partial [Romboutsia sp.]|uniref:RNA-guided endonuclease TnpB family protein n=1 Tax=Romboutsia sp. TaxID=1965302 RepID=UPI003F319E88